MYLLDTNVLSELARRRPHSNVLLCFQSAGDEELFTAAVCIEEIYFGIRAGPNGDVVRQRMETRVLHRVTERDFSAATARLAGEMRGEWKIRGTPVGYRDGLIAATAKANDLTLVTRNVRHFDHIAGLKIKNWFEPQAPTAGQSPGN